MNNTSINSENPSENSNALAYYYIGLSLAFILLMMFMSLFSCYWQNRLLSRGINNSNPNRTVIWTEGDTAVINIEDAILNSYPILLYSQVKFHHKADSTSLICSICLGDYKDSEWLRFLPDCGHFFHKECIATWFRLNLSCPLCRNSPLPTALPTPLAEVTLLATTHD